MEVLQTTKVGVTVARDYRTASVFQKYGIDFCCKGGLSIEDACKRKEVDKDEVLTAISEILAADGSSGDDFNSWPLDKLADYIEQKHHRYVTEQTPILLQFLEKLCRVHGSRHPELFDIESEFNYVARELAMHMKKEELVLFPAVKKLAEANQNDDKNIAFGSIQAPIQTMMQEHDIEGERMVKIAGLSDSYAAPADGCTTYRIAFQMLKDFEEDLHKHIHLENNILFPKALELEIEIQG